MASQKKLMLLCLLVSAITIHLVAGNNCTSAGGFNLAYYSNSTLKWQRTEVHCYVTKQTDCSKNQEILLSLCSTIDVPCGSCTSAHCCSVCQKSGQESICLAKSFEDAWPVNGMRQLVDTPNSQVELQLNWLEEIWYKRAQQVLEKHLSLCFVAQKTSISRNSIKPYLLGLMVCSFKNLIASRSWKEEGPNREILLTEF